PPERSAAHLLLTAGETDEFVVATLRAAASRSLAQGAPDAAVTYLMRALDGVSDAERAEILVDLGLAERLRDAGASAGHLYAALELLDDPVRRAEVALELGGVLFYANRGAEAIDVFRRGLEEIDPVRYPDLHEQLESQVIGSTWWDEAHFPIA